MGHQKKPAHKMDMLMQIDFNTNRIANSGLNKPIHRQEGTPSSTDTTSFTAAAALNAQLNDVPAVRTDKVALAKSLIKDPDYPPAELLDKVANLMSQNI